jgi:hypothetical protein
MRKLSEHVEIERGLRSIYGKSKGTLVSNVGASPAPYDAIPDYADIWYQPDDDPRKEDETQMREARREAMGVANRGKYGFHGTADAEDTPLLRYETDDFPQNANPQRPPNPEKARANIVQPNKYPQPSVKTGPIKHVVQREKMYGHAFGDSNEPHEASEAPEASDASSAPSLSKRPKAVDAKPQVRNEKTVRYVAQTKPPKPAQRMGR